jgi:hypothetical protein
MRAIDSDPNGRSIPVKLSLSDWTGPKINPERGSPSALRHRKPGDQLPAMLSAAEPRALCAQVLAVLVQPDSPEAHCCPRSGRKESSLTLRSIDGRQLIVNVLAALVPPPGVRLTTVTAAVPAVLMSAAGTVAVNVVLLTCVVASFTPFHSMTEPTT